MYRLILLISLTFLMTDSEPSVAADRYSNQGKIVNATSMQDAKNKLGCRFPVPLGNGRYECVHNHDDDRKDRDNRGEVIWESEDFMRDRNSRSRYDRDRVIREPEDFMRDRNSRSRYDRDRVIRESEDFMRDRDDRNTSWKGKIVNATSMQDAKNKLGCRFPVPLGNGRYECVHDHDDDRRNQDNRGEVIWESEDFMRDRNSRTRYDRDRVIRESEDFMRDWDSRSRYDRDRVIRESEDFMRDRDDRNTSWKGKIVNATSMQDAKNKLGCRFPVPLGNGRYECVHDHD